MTLTADELALLPTDEEVAEYRERGWYRSRPLFTDAELDAAIAGSARFYAGEVEPRRSVPDRHIPTGEPQGGLLKHDYASWLRPELGALVHKPILAAVAARLMGTDEVRLWHDQLLLKPAELGGEGPAVGWHTDRLYWQMCTSDDMLTAWIPFHDCDERMGTITMLDGSHQWDTSTMALSFFERNHEAVEERLRADGYPIRPVAVELRRGQVSFHNARTVHGSPSNRSGAPRRAIAVHFQDGPNRHRETVDLVGRRAEHQLDTLCRSDRGQPDYTDPEWCPVLWPPSHPRSGRNAY